MSKISADFFQPLSKLKARVKNVEAKYKKIQHESVCTPNTG